VLSGDPPRSKVLNVGLIVIVLALAFAPFLFPGSKRSMSRPRSASSSRSRHLTICCSAIPVWCRSRTTMFYGIGSYGIAISLFSLWRALGCDRARAAGGAAARGLAGAGDRTVLAARHRPSSLR
jgi:branched-chain amino acid transport system permease protein